MVKTKKYLILGLSVVLLIGLMPSCNNVNLNKDKELYILADAIIGGDVTSNYENYIIVKINNISDYNSKDNLGLLPEGDVIKVYISIINSKNKINPSTYIKSFNGKIRCLDGRINSLETFNKSSCYWEAREGEF